MDNASNAVTKLPEPYNRSAIKRHALKVSVETRQGKFTRVSSEFIADVEALIESKLRELRRPVLDFAGREVEPGEETFLTGEGKKRLVEAFNRFVANEIHRKIKDIRVGKTL